VDVFVELTLDLVDGRTPYDRGDLRLALRHLVFWCHATAGLELDSGMVLRREIIDRFVRVGLTEYSPGSQANLRSQLLRIAELLMDRRHAPARLRPLAAGTRPPLTAAKTSSPCEGGQPHNPPPNDARTQRFSSASGSGPGSSCGSPELEQGRFQFQF